MRKAVGVKERGMLTLTSIGLPLKVVVTESPFHRVHDESFLSLGYLPYGFEPVDASDIR